MGTSAAVAAAVQRLMQVADSDTISIMINNIGIVQGSSRNGQRRGAFAAEPPVCMAQCNVKWCSAVQCIVCIA
jgi:hypothetical protein